MSHGARQVRKSLGFLHAVTSEETVTCRHTVSYHTSYDQVAARNYYNNNNN